MNAILRRKLESAIIAFVKATASPSLAAQTMVEGHTNAEPAVPYHVCYVSDSRAHSDMPPELGIVEATVIWHQKSDANDEARADADKRLEEIFWTLLAPLDKTQPISDANRLAGALIAALDKPAGDAPDKRPVKGLHVYDFLPQDDRDQMAETKWNDQLVFTCVAQPYDSH